MEEYVYIIAPRYDMALDYMRYRRLSRLKLRYFNDETGMMGLKDKTIVVLGDPGILYCPWFKMRVESGKFKLSHEEVYPREE